MVKAKILTNEEKKDEVILPSPPFQKIIGEDLINPRIRFVGGGTNISSLYNKQVVSSSFESLDGWLQTINGGSIVLALGGTTVQTTNSTFARVTLNDEIAGLDGVDFLNKNPVFECVFALNTTTNQIIYFGAGNLSIDDGTEEGFGFKIDNSTLYSLTTESDGTTATEYLTDIGSGITLTRSNIFRAEMISGAKTVNFYVNEILRSVHTNVPNDKNNPVLMNFYIRTREGVVKRFYIRNTMFYQDFNPQ